MKKKIVLIIDAKVGATEYDLEILRRLKDRERNVVVIANKIDKIKKSEYKKQLAAIQAAVGDYPVIPYSATEKTGINGLFAQIS